MSLFVSQTSSGVGRTDSFAYQALTDDPQFIYRFWMRRPRYMVVFIAAIDDVLDPKVYVDRGSGFDESDAILLRHKGACIYSISITPPYRVGQIRIDPCTALGRFRYWAKFAWSEKILTKLLVQAKGSTQGDLSVYNIEIDGTHDEGKKRSPQSSIQDHFSSVVRLAGRTAPPIDPVGGKPFISFVVPVYDTSQAYLNDLLESFHEQPVGSAELILCDDGSTSADTIAWLSEHEGVPGTRVVRSGQNLGIAAATNAGITVARGDWISFVDHDDALTPGVVQLIAEAARDNPECKFIYTDEVITDEELRPIQYFFKPAYDEVLLSGVNYVNHLSCYRRDRLVALGGLRMGYEGSQDYDLLLRYLRGLKSDEIKHLPYPGYRWRRGDKTFSTQFRTRAIESARAALAERYRCGDVMAVVDDAISNTLHRVRFDVMKVNWPRVSVVIPNRDSFQLMSCILTGLMHGTDYPDLEIIVVDNGTTDERVLNLYHNTKLEMASFKYEIDPVPFNFSRQVNRGISLATGELILLLNNDVEVLEPGWLREMVSCFSYRDTGVVGARLLYPTGHLQHAGVIVGLGGLAGHWFLDRREDFPGPMARLHVRQSFTAVTGACMLISRACIETVGGFDEEGFAIAYNDVDFCLRAVSKGFRIVWTPFSTLIHHESASRGGDETGPNRERFKRDRERLVRVHNTQTFEDRAFSPWYRRDLSEPVPHLLDHLPKAR